MYEDSEEDLAEDDDEDLAGALHPLGLLPGASRLAAAAAEVRGGGRPPHGAADRTSASTRLVLPAAARHAPAPCCTTRASPAA